jgi:hypothetical protein
MHLNLNERAYGCTSSRLALAAGQMLRDFGVSSDVSEVRGMKHGAVVASSSLSHCFDKLFLADASSPRVGVLLATKIRNTLLSIGNDRKKPNLDFFRCGSWRPDEKRRVISARAGLVARSNAGCSRLHPRKRKV